MRRFWVLEYPPLSAAPHIYSKIYYWLLNYIAKIDDGDYNRAYSVRVLQRFIFKCIIKAPTHPPQKETWLRARIIIITMYCKYCIYNLLVLIVVNVWRVFVRRRNDDVTAVVLQARTHETRTVEGRHARRAVCFQA